MQENSVAKPTFINIGPGRCATSWLAEVFRSHPDITMSNVKETEFFNINYALGEQWYESHFESRQTLAAGEISNNYYLDASIPEKIKNYDKNIKLIINLRDPFALLSSYYNFGIRRGLVFKDIESALATPIGSIMGSGYSERLQQNQLAESDQVTLLESVLLAERMQPFLEAFDSSQIYIFIYERLNQDHLQVIEEIYSFLGVDSSFVPPSAGQVVNASIQPKSRTLAKIATKTSYFLRKYGFYRLLSTLHRSKLIKKVLYREGESSNIGRGDLNLETTRKIENSISRLKNSLPDLEKYWP